MQNAKPADWIVHQCRYQLCREHCHCDVPRVAMATFTCNLLQRSVSFGNEGVDVIHECSLCTRPSSHRGRAPLSRGPGWAPSAYERPWRGSVSRLCSGALATDVWNMRGWGGGGSEPVCWDLFSLCGQLLWDSMPEPSWPPGDAGKWRRCTPDVSLADAPPHSSVVTRVCWRLCQLLIADVIRLSVIWESKWNDVFGCMFCLPPAMRKMLCSFVLIMNGSKKAICLCLW